MKKDWKHEATPTTRTSSTSTYAKEAALTYVLKHHKQSSENVALNHSFTTVSIYVRLKLYCLLSFKSRIEAANVFEDDTLKSQLIIAWLPPGAPRLRGKEELVEIGLLCRTRRVKCDETQPTCSMCRHIGVACSGYHRTIFFSSEGSDGTDRFRRPLFTEQQRKRMSLSLIHSVPTDVSLSSFLSRMEEECENAESIKTNDVCINRGPFGVFKVATNPSAEAITSEIDDSIPFNSIESIDGHMTVSVFPTLLETQDVLDTSIIPADLLQDSRSESLQFGIPTEILLPDHFSSWHPAPDSDVFIDFGNNISQNSGSVFSSQDISLIGRKDINLVLKEAVVLLKHYSTGVIGILTPWKHAKTLWHVLFVPHVKNTLAALCLEEEPDEASLGCFYGVLAISAFHLAAMSRSGSWHRSGCGFARQARDYGRSVIQTAYIMPKVSKYKSILMALLTMVQLSMFDGHSTQTEYYLLESEKFIRLRGLHRRKSRKRRLLHHCYVFMRIFHESLFTTYNQSLQRLHVRLAVESSGLIVAGSDRPMFRISAWNNLSQRMLEAKGILEGENDLHLERPGHFPATMYPEIYGLSEEWLVMLSQVIRLGNEKDPQQDDVSSLSLREFSSRAKDLEHCILNWQQYPMRPVSLNRDGSDVDEKAMQSLLSALHQALIIYFYRRIYDVDVSMLQERVRNVRDFLLVCDRADPERICFTFMFMWSAFVAGCEAEGDDLRSSFATWFEHCALQSGQSTARQLNSIVQGVWCRRTELGEPKVTWLDFLKNPTAIDQ